MLNFSDDHAIDIISIPNCIDICVNITPAELIKIIWPSVVPNITLNNNKVKQSVFLL